MGGIGFSIEIERVGTEADAVSLVELHRSVWDTISGQFGLLSHAAHAETFDDYAGQAVYDGLGEGDSHGEWDRSDTSLGFSFSDMAGCCSMSYYAMYHWSWLAFVDCREAGLFRTRGWKILGDRVLPNAVLVAGDCFAYAGGRLFCVQPDDERAGFGDSREVPWTALTADERADVEWIRLTGLCGCELCAMYRDQCELPVERDLEAARRAAELLRGADRTLVAEAAKAVATWIPSGPHATELPPTAAVLTDWLLERDVRLDRLAFASMLLRRRA